MKASLSAAVASLNNTVLAFACSSAALALALAAANWLGVYLLNSSSSAVASAAIHACWAFAGVRLLSASLCALMASFRLSCSVVDTDLPQAAANIKPIQAPAISTLFLMVFTFWSYPQLVLHTLS